MLKQILRIYLLFVLIALTILTATIHLERADLSRADQVLNWYKNT